MRRASSNVNMNNSRCFAVARFDRISYPRHMLPPNLGLCALLIATGLAVGCADGGGGTGTPKEPDPVWWSIGLPSLERGDSAFPVLRRKGVEVPQQPRAWAAVPAASVRIAADGKFHFLEAGDVTLQAFVDGQLVADTTIEVAMPPIILFDQVVDGNRDVYSIALDGRDETRLTTHAAADQDAASELDTLVFTSYRDGNAELYAKGLSGGVETRLTFTAAEEREVAVYYHPDFTYMGYGEPERPWLEIAYARNDDGVFKIWRGARLTSTPSRAAPKLGSASSEESTPTFGFAGILALASTASGTSQIYSVGDILGMRQPFNAGPGPNFEADLANGRDLLFISTRTGTAKLHVYDFSASAVVPGAGSERQPVSVGGYRGVFLSDRTGSPQLYWIYWTSANVLHHIPVSGSDPQRPAFLRERSHY